MLVAVWGGGGGGGGAGMGASLANSYLEAFVLITKSLSTKSSMYKTVFHLSKLNTFVGPQGFWGSWENGYLFSGSWGALVIILGELGSKLTIFWDLGSLAPPPKKKRKSLHFV